ncbi:hypothetical protein G4V62_17170 [Bacillaceae bacterium SIJ1]|uniref:hypothetical protein n=1 Tax=Litoribacterium kuwaitense TaxID=1398745 RepID=UPI0013EE3387|nr:hypothetical protein [Litoribacterium kuwaitense]NGP46590.1 hypothetical protein [Litoribacterium kuwaitense]
MKGHIWRRFLVAVISAILFSLWQGSVWLSAIDGMDLPAEIMPQDLSFWNIFLFIALYALPVFLLIGIPASIMMDNWVAKKATNWKTLKKTLISFVCYSAGGAVFGALSILSIARDPRLMVIGVVLGIAGAMAYWGVLQVAQMIGKRPSSHSL